MKNLTSSTYDTPLSHSFTAVVAWELWTTLTLFFLSPRTGNEGSAKWSESDKYGQITISELLLYDQFSRKFCRPKYDEFRNVFISFHHKGLQSWITLSRLLILVCRGAHPIESESITSDMYIGLLQGNFRQPLAMARYVIHHGPLHGGIFYITYMSKSRVMVGVIVKSKCKYTGASLTRSCRWINFAAKQDVKVLTYFYIFFTESCNQPSARFICRSINSLALPASRSQR